MPPQNEIALVIPCFNEEKRLDAADYDLFLSSFPVDIYFVDDGSRDKTRALLNRIQSEHPAQVRVVALGKNQGKAEAVRTGVLAALDAGYQLVGYFDADLSTPLTAATELADRLGHDKVMMVMGSRVKMMGCDIVRRPLRHYCGRVFATIACQILGMPIYDTQCGAKLFVNNDATRRIFEIAFRVNWTFDVELIWRFCLAFGYPGIEPNRIFVEYPLKAWRDVGGSKISRRDIGIIFFELYSLYRLIRDPAYQEQFTAKTP